VVISIGIESDRSAISFIALANRIHPRDKVAPPYRGGYRRYPEIYRRLRPAAHPAQ